MVDKKTLAGMNNEVWTAYMMVVDNLDNGEKHEESVGVLLDRMAQAVMLLLDREIER